MPMMYGIGEQQISNMDVGNTGMNVWGHAKGYSNDVTAWMQEERVLE